MKPTPQGWSRISSGLYYRDAAAMIDWLCQAFGFEVRLRVEGEHGRVAHAELTYGDGVVMIGEERRGEAQRFGHDAASPLSVGGANTQGLMIYIDDFNTHRARARGACAPIARETKPPDYRVGYCAHPSF